MILKSIISTSTIKILGCLQNNILGVNIAKISNFCNFNDYRRQLNDL